LLGTIAFANNIADTLNEPSIAIYSRIESSNLCLFSRKCTLGTVRYSILQVPPLITVVNLRQLESNLKTQPLTEIIFCLALQNVSRWKLLVIVDRRTVVIPFVSYRLVSYDFSLSLYFSLSSCIMNLYLAFLVLFVPAVVSQDTCGPAGTFYIAGSTTVEPIALTWAAGYTAKCPGVTVNVTGGGSTVGARKVCNLTSAGFPAEIGNLSREWRTSEANLTAPFKYACNQGDKTRTLTQVEVAIDGLSVVLINGGLVARCIRNNVTGKGLTIDQLRWIYSNYTQTQLLASGWKASALGNSDGNDNTHLWSELNKACPPFPIKLASPGILSGTFSFFKETVLPNATEGIAANRPGAPLFLSEDDEALVQYVAVSSADLYGDAIVYFGYAYYSENGQLFYGVPIQPISGGDYIKPTQQTVEDGLYTPLSRRIYMNFLDSALPLTAAFLSYGFNPEGIKRLEKTGYVKPTRTEIVDGLKLVGRDAPIPTAAPVKPPTFPPVFVAPAGSPPTPAGSPAGTPTRKACGLLGLSIFCPFTFCGVFGRLLGLCRA
jgi:phosphate transport system substrate-binding protein